MAKKIVRGITDVKTITKQGFDTNNVNDLLSDGEHSYIHRKKKDGTEEYHNLTNNVKTITSSNTDLLKVTNRNNSDNTVTLTPQLTAGDGLTLKGSELELTHIEGFKGDLNTLKTTQIVKTTTGATNLPAKESIPDGLLEITRCGDIAKQVYTPFTNSVIYHRTANNVGKTGEKWYDWKKIALEALSTATSVIPEVDIEE